MSTLCPNPTGDDYILLTPLFGFPCLLKPKEQNVFVFICVFTFMTRKYNFFKTKVKNFFDSAVLYTINDYCHFGIHCQLSTVGVDVES